MAYDFMYEDIQPVPEITVDYEKCPVPLTCRKCLERCPQAVYVLDTIKYVKFQETDITEPGAYKVMARHRDKCTGCEDCVKECPEGALTVRMKGVGVNE